MDTAIDMEDEVVKCEIIKCDLRGCAKLIECEDDTVLVDYTCAT